MAYLDHAASTRIRPVAVDAWAAASMQEGNPSSTHSAGRWGRRAVEDARESIAAHLGIPPDSICFVSGGTEADNMGITGIVAGRRAVDSRRDVVITSPIEHKAVLDPARALESSGITVETIRVDSRGVIELEHLRELLQIYRGRVAVVAVMWANNEVGTIQPIDEVVAMCRPARIPVHSDAVQAVGAASLDLNLPNTSALSAHKLGGPKGVGIFVNHNRYPIDPVLRGGGQENKMRAGTLNVPGIVGMAAAFDETFADIPAAIAKYRGLRDQIIEGARAIVPDVVINGDPENGLPSLAHLSFPGCEGDSLMLLLDAAGVQVSVGSACNAGATTASHVLSAMGADPMTARSSLRISVGWSTTGDDVDLFLKVLPEAVTRARQAGMSTPVEGRV
ncbi:MAG: cysteine desulfurase [Actinobacteria bacterium]|nr:cysteine desulfurase [Actinomycetota bacterium]